MPTVVATALESGTPEQATARGLAELREKLAGAEPVLVSVFASTQQPLEAVIGPVSRAFPTSVVLGASSAGEFTERGHVKGALAMFALAGDFHVFAGIRITESEPMDQVISARTAARRAVDQTGGAPVAGALVFDCICRDLILNSEFQTAVRSISVELGDVPLAGFATYGEIALEAGDLSGFHNSTTVILAFPE